MGRRDESDFVAFAEACRPALRRTAYLMCGDWERAADITQEALVRVYVAWPRLERDHGLRAYARRGGELRMRPRIPAGAKEATP